MNCSNKSQCIPHRRNLVVERGLDMKLQEKQAKYYLKWCILNLLLLIVLQLHYHNKCECAESFWFQLEYGAIVLISLNAIVDITKYLYYVFKKEPLHCTLEQKKLLKFDDNESSFIVLKPKKDEPTTVSADESRYDEDIIRKWRPSFNTTTIRTYGSTNWNLVQQSSQQPLTATSTMYDSQVGKVNKHQASSSLLDLDRGKPIEDETSLQEYLKRQEKEEDVNDDDDNLFNNSKCFDSFWNYGISAGKPKLYHLATINEPVFHDVMPNSDERNCMVIRRISSENLSRYVKNLRAWIFVTILKRLTEEIENVNDSLKRIIYLNIQIGSSDLVALKKITRHKQLVDTQAPALPLIIPFLDLISNQEYLLQRIKDFSNGSYITNYRWNAGSDNLHFKWNDQLPTDAAIIFHFFCVYMDSQLLPLSQYENRPFYSRYIIIGENNNNRSVLDTVAMIKNRAHCAILCTNPLHPKFNFISHGEIHNCAYDNNNLFHVIIQFLLYMRTYQESRLEGVSLGSSGINIMWIIEN